MKRIFLSILSLSLLTLCLGCTEKRAVAHDLVRESFFADQSGIRTPVVDNGTFQGRVHEVYGFGQPERRPDKETFGSAQGESSKLRFVVGEPADLMMTFSVRGTETDVDKVRLDINDRPLGEIELTNQFTEFKFPLPAELLLPGENSLSLSYFPVPEVDRFTRNGVEWKQFHFEPKSGESRLVQEGNEVSLVLPAETRLDYFYKLDPGSVFETGPLQNLVQEGQVTESVTLQLTVQGKDSGPWLREFEPGQEHSVDLPDMQGPVRLSLLCLAKEKQGLGSTSLSLQPRITVPVKASNSSEPAPVEKFRVENPNILVFLVDTMRSDHAGCYGYHRNTTPELDEFAKESTIFEQGRAPSSFTKTSVASLVTGLSPRSHGVLDFQAKLQQEETLPQALLNRGYATAGFNTNDWLTKEFGFSVGYQHYTSENGARAQNVVEKGLTWLDQRTPKTPFFLYLHLIEPHLAYRPEEPYREIMAPHLSHEFGLQTKALISQLKREGLEPREGLVQDFIDLYDGEILCADKSFGDLVDGLKERGLYDSTLIVFLSDHGEEFLDHGGWEHGATLYEESVRVPIVVKFPEGYGAGALVDSVARLVDIFPTILDYLGEPRTMQLDGVSLLPAVAGTEESKERGARFGSLVISAEESTDPLGGFYRVEVDSVIEDGLKLVRYHEHYTNRYHPIEMYDLDADPQEKNSLISDSIEVGYRLFKLREHLTRQVLRDGADIEIVKDRLKTLQYI